MPYTRLAYKRVSACVAFKSTQAFCIKANLAVIANITATRLKNGGAYPFGLLNGHKGVQLH